MPRRADVEDSDRPLSCAIYARVSTKRQAEENTSIAVQLEAAQRYAAERGWHVYKEYADRGASGRSDKGRPQFSEMIAEGMKPDPPFTVILVYDHSRFFRNTGLSEVTRAALRLNAVEVRSITQPIKDDGLLGSLAITFQAAVDQQSSSLTAIKVRDGLEASAREGFYVGGNIPYGYSLEQAERRGSKIKNKLIMNPAEAHVVRLIFDLYLGGLGIKSITKKLNSDGIYNRRGNKWQNSTIGNMLTTTTYAGRHLFRPTDWRTKKTLPRTEWIEIPCPAIIDEATFQNVQRVLKERQPRNTPPRDTTSDVLLAKLARCGSCGGPLQSSTGTGRNGEVYRYYKCAAKIGTGSCPGGNPTSIPRDYLDDLTIRTITDQLLTTERVQEIVSLAAKVQSSAQVEASSRLGQLKRQLKAAERKESNLWDIAAEEGVRARSGFVAKLDAIQEEVAGINRQISAHEQLIASAIRPLTRSEAEQKASTMRELLLTADIKKKRQFVRALIDTVVVKDDIIEIMGAESTLAECASDVDIRSTPRFAVLPGGGGR